MDDKNLFGGKWLGIAFATPHSGLANLPDSISSLTTGINTKSDTAMPTTITPECRLSPICPILIKLARTQPQQNNYW